MPATTGVRPRTLFSFCVLVALCASCSLLVTTSAAGDFPGYAGDPWRLDDRVVPTFQKVHLVTDPGADDYTGVTEIDLRVNETTDRFRLHAFEMDLGAATLWRDGRELFALEVAPSEADLHVFTAPRSLEPGDYRLRLEFANDYDRRARALYKLEYEGEDYLSTQFQAIDGRGAFPCFDEPRFKIEWQVVLTAPSEDLAVSNTPVEATEVEGAMTTTTFLRTKPMPSYLVALAVGPWERVPVEGLDVPAHVITPKGKQAMAAWAVETTPPLLRALEDYFGLPYPYRKLDLIAVPEFQYGAMENVGLITFRENILLIDPDAATVGQKRSLAAVNAHELAHMWYGNLVTMEWWDDLWLNESFATWMGNKITDQVYPEFGLAVTTVQGAEYAKSIDARQSTNAMRAAVAADAIEGSLDSGIAYQKGEAVLGMFEQFAGEEAFRDGVRAYVDRHAWKNTRADDLLEALTETTGVDFESIMSTFLDQPGVPEVRMTALGDGKVELRQSRFSTLGWEPTGEELWKIPVVFSWSDGEQVRRQRVLLTEPTQIVELPQGADPEWIHPNTDERGYYRWDVGTESLLNLIERSAEVLSPRERVALVSQLSAQLDAGRLGGGDYLRACGLLAKDPRPEVLSASLGSLAKVRAAFVTAEEMPAFRAWVSDVCRPALERFGLTPREGEDEAVNLARPALITWLGRWGGDEEVRAFARDVASRYLEDRDSVDPSIAGACLSVAAIDGGWRLYNEYKTAFEEATVPAERSRFLGALGDFSDKAMQDAALHYALNGPLRPQELFTIPQSVAMGSTDRPDRLWNWFVENYDQIVEKMPPAFKAYMPYFAGGCEEERLVAAREFFAQPEHQAPGQERQLERVAEGVRECVELRGREGESVRAFLDTVAGSD